MELFTGSHNNPMFLQPKPVVDRDTRWEKVWASVGPWPHNIDDPIASEYSKGMLEFRIEVRYNDIRHYTVQRIHKDDLADLQFDGFKFILNEMVRQLDAHIETKEPYTYG